MAQVINTNVAALFAGSALNKSAIALQTAQQRLSSGLRINSAKDDATGLGIATGYDSQIRGTNMAIRNANDGISSAQTNDGRLAQVTENLQRLREIFVQVGATAFSSNVEAKALVAEDVRIALLTKPTTAAVIDSSGATASVVGVSVTLAAATAGAYATIGDIDTDLTTVTTGRSKYGADMSTFASAIANLQVTSVNLSASYSRIMDTDYAAETASMTRNNILQQAGTAVLAQANQTPNTVLSLLR